MNKCLRNILYTGIAVGALLAAGCSYFSQAKKEPVQETIPWDEDVEKLLPIIDNLFANLPDNIIDEFTKSEDFKLYEKVVLKYKIAVSVCFLFKKHRPRQ